jgi:hypothetical protein
MGGESRLLQVISLIHPILTQRRPINLHQPKELKQLFWGSLLVEMTHIVKVDDASLKLLCAIHDSRELYLNLD